MIIIGRPKHDRCQNCHTWKDDVYEIDISRKERHFAVLYLCRPCCLLLATELLKEMEEGAR